MRRIEEITLLKLQKEAETRKKNDELIAKLAKVQHNDIEYKKELYAKSMQMNQRRDLKIESIRKQERQNEAKMLREHDKLMK